MHSGGWSSAWGATPAPERKAEYNIPMRARYYRQDYNNGKAPLQPGQKNASVVLLIRYQ
ncbi:hypothetical protein D3C84_1248850 [compost metagenome]